MRDGIRRAVLPGNVPILVPDSPASMTAFVIEEQQDWFEPELPFLRRLVQPGWTCVDVGAGYGCYALSLAAAAGPKGRVTAIEPHPEVGQLLAESAALQRGAAPIAVERMALAEAAGTGSLTNPKDPELAELAKSGEIEVGLATLDDVLGGARPDLIKIDVEGAGDRVLQGARKTLSGSSPVIQFVLRQGGRVQLRAIDQLVRSGFLVCRLLPGPGVLVPILPGEPVDDFCLNAFAIRPEREEDLRARGLAIEVAQGDEAPASNLKVQDVLDAIAAEPWIAPWKPQWMANAIQPGWDAQRRAVALAAHGSRADLSARDRAASLRLSLAASSQALAQSVTGSRLATAARVAHMLGQRSDAKMCLEQLLAAVTGGVGKIEDTFREPFLLPLPEHESATYPTFGDMLTAAVLESAAVISVYSAFFVPVGRNELAERIAALKVRSPRSERTARLLAARKAQRPVLRL